MWRLFHSEHQIETYRWKTDRKIWKNAANLSGRTQSISVQWYGINRNTISTFVGDTANLWEAYRTDYDWFAGEKSSPRQENGATGMGGTYEQSKSTGRGIDCCRANLLLNWIHLIEGWLQGSAFFHVEWQYLNCILETSWSVFSTIQELSKRQCNNTDNNKTDIVILILSYPICFNTILVVRIYSRLTIYRKNSFSKENRKKTHEKVPKYKTMSW